MQLVIGYIYQTYSFLVTGTLFSCFGVFEIQKVTLEVTKMKLFRMACKLVKR